MAKRTRGDAASPSYLLEETRKLDKHPNKLLEGLNRLRLNKVFCDVVLCCGGKEIPCHRVVLASISSYFEGMFTTGMLESTQDRVNVDGVSPEVVDMLVSFAYTSEVSISTDNVQALLAGADLMDVIDVRKACCDYMECHMTIYNCVEIHLLADRYSCQKLEKSSLDYILEYFSVVYKQEEFLSVSVDKLTEILSSDHLNMPEEHMVFDAAILWLNTCTDRRLTFDKVLEHIRLPLFRPCHLHTVIESLDVVKEHQGCQRFISEAKTYQRLVSEAEVDHLLSYRNTARPRRTTVIVVVKDMSLKAYSFDPRTNQWTILRRSRDLEIRVGPCVVASDTGSVLYMAGGRLPNSTISKEMWCYDLQRDEWLKRDSMNEARYGCGLVMLDGCLFALGGVHTNGTYEKSVERYDPNSNTWQRMKSVNMPYFDFVKASLVALDGLIYVFGCTDEEYSTFRYNPITGEWTEVVPMQNPRIYPAACTLNGKIYAIGGQNTAGHLTAEVECFNPKTNQWTMCAPMRNRSLNPPVAVVDEMIYVLGTSNRFDQILSRTIERYCAETDTWETIGKTPFGDCVTLSVRLRNDALSTPCNTADDDDDEDDEDLSESISVFDSDRESVVLSHDSDPEEEDEEDYLPRIIDEVDEDYLHWA